MFWYKYFFIFLTLFFAQTAFCGQATNAVSSSEIHKLHVIGRVKYRCYAGYSGKKSFDEITKKPCDNKTYEKTVVDKIVAIEIKDEPDPENSKDLAGSWDESFSFKDRKFEIAISLFKPEVSSYRLRLVANDNQPVSRNTAVYADVKNITDINPLIIDYNSVGKKEEIQFWVEVKSPVKK